MAKSKICKTRGRPVQASTIRQLERDITKQAKSLTKKVEKIRKLRDRYNDCGNRAIKVGSEAASAVRSIPTINNPS